MANTDTPVVTNFQTIAPLLLQKYERYLPSAFDNSLSILEKVNKVIQFLNDETDLLNDMIDQWNAVLNNALGDGITTAVDDILIQWKNDGTLDYILNQTFLDVGDLSKLGTNPRTLVESILDYGINVKDFDAIGNANFYNPSNGNYYEDDQYTILANDDTSAFQDAVDFIESNLDKHYKLYIPSGNFLINGVVTISYPFEICGVYNSFDQSKTSADLSGGYYGTNIVGGINLSKDPVFKFRNVYDPANDDFFQNRIQGGFLNGLYFRSDRHERDGIHFIKTGWQAEYNKVFVDGFKGCGVLFDTNYDTNMYGLTVVNCGGKQTDGTIKYAVDFTSSFNHNTNAFHVFGLHIERSRYFLRLDIARNIQFFGSKIEFGTNDIIESDNSSNPPIKITNQSREIKFIGSMFVAQSVENWQSQIPTLSLSEIPYFIEGDTGYDYWLQKQQMVTFSECDFTSIGGAKMIDSKDTKMEFIGGTYGELTTKTYSLKLKNGKMISPSFEFRVTDGDNNGYGIYIEDSKVIHPNLNLVNSLNADLINSVGITFIGDKTVIDSPIFEENKFETSLLNQSGMGEAKIITRKTDSSLIIDESLLPISDYSDVTIDNGQFDTDFLKLNLSQNATIKNIINSWSGANLIIFNNTANTITLNNNGNINLKNTQTVTLNGGEFIKLVSVIGQWYEETTYKKV